MDDQKYILDGKTPVPADLMTWARWFESADRSVAKDTIGESEVSTVFLGINHQWGDGPLHLFETLVFGGPLADEMGRYPTWDEAVRGHDEMVARVRATLN